ncbi:B12-binding domain-containing radical SAM protein [Clostridium sp. CF011]|uniref:B12-binding domain-containing radical SAM protein n=1 Tax=Clostridium sp. CF011 TaxID=2843318 RepID=UPI001C0B2EB1|nr:radical SAM protein [Clostridium sp. CF011]MBU3093526.1 B12-binding domain-containing radical SAM protein [Clostridium sp. CF011]WAG71737.1 B12-binding domain-containing radical SAM protein [Clostridium sp. CF011]
MKIKFILPGFKNMNSREFKSLMFRFWFPSLTISMLAALTPEEYDISFIDELFESNDCDEKVDIVVISAMTAQVIRGYNIADKYRKRGVTVVIGGIHASILPIEAKKHADSVLIGEAEYTWGKMLNDFECGNLKEFYKADKFADLKLIPRPNRSIFDNKIRPKHGTVNSLQATRGCPFNCDFCSVTNFFGNTFRVRDTADIIDEIKTLKMNEEICFIDDNIYGNTNFAKGLFREMKDLNIKWSGQGSINLADDEELLNLCAESGCSGLLVGIESINENNIININKKSNNVYKYKESIKKIQDKGIKILGSFIFGLEDDRIDVFEKTLKFVEDTELSLPLFNILTPYPGTKVAQNLIDEHRIISYDWSDYTATKTVYKPRLMSVDELNEGYKWMYTNMHSGINETKNLGV